MIRAFFAQLSLVICAVAPVPENLVVEGVLEIPDALKADAGRFLEFRSAAFQSRHPLHRGMLITMRFAEPPPLHLLRMPGD